MPLMYAPGTALMPCVLRLFGAHVGHDLLVANDIPMSLFCIDARHISIGDGVVMNQGADVIPHSVDRGLIGHPLMRWGPSLSEPEACCRDCAKVRGQGMPCRRLQGMYCSCSSMVVQVLQTLLGPCQSQLPWSSIANTRLCPQAGIMAGLDCDRANRCRPS